MAEGAAGSRVRRAAPSALALTTELCRGALQRWDLEQARGYAQWAAELAVAGKDQPGEVRSLLLWASAYAQDWLRYPKARPIYERAAAIAADIPDPLLLATIYIDASLVDATLGDARVAYDRTSKVFGLGERVTPSVRATAMANLALFTTYAGDPQGGRGKALEALSYIHQHDLDEQEATTLHNLAVAEAMLGDVASTIEHGERALAIETERRVDANAPLLADLALWYARADNLSAAQERVAQLLGDETAIERGLPPRTAYCWWLAAQTLRACGEREMSGNALARASEVITQVGAMLDDIEKRRYLAVPWHRQVQEAIRRSSWPALNKH